jgi:hypothetical protein
MDDDATRRRPAEKGSVAKAGELDPPLQAIGFEVEELSPSRITGRLLVTPTCCQVSRSVPTSYQPTAAAGCSACL